MEKYGFYIGVFIAIMIIPFFSNFSEVNAEAEENRPAEIKLELNKKDKKMTNHELVLEDKHAF